MCHTMFCVCFRWAGRHVLGNSTVRRKGGRIAHGKMNCSSFATEASAISTESSEIALQSSSFLKARVNAGCPCGDVFGVTSSLRALLLDSAKSH